MALSSYQETIGVWQRHPTFTFALHRAITLFPPDGDPAERQRLMVIESIQLGRPESGEKKDAAGRVMSRPAVPVDGDDAIDTFLDRYLPADRLQPEAAIQALGEPAGIMPDSTPPASPTPRERELQARNLIRNRNYREALAIIQDLNLNNPEKSIYFADQIRFLKKLIINQTKVNS